MDSSLIPNRGPIRHHSSTWRRKAKKDPRNPTRVALNVNETHNITCFFPFSDLEHMYHAFVHMAVDSQIKPDHQLLLQQKEVVVITTNQHPSPLVKHFWNIIEICCCIWASLSLHRKSISVLSPPLL